MDKYEASVFIPTGNRSQSLKRVLASLSSQTFKNFEILIVDYRSTDDTFKVIDAFKRKLRIRLINQKSKGLVKAANLAIENAAGGIFIRTDDDVVMKPYWLESIVDSFKKDHKIGGVTGPTVIPDNFLKNRDLFLFQQKLKRGNLFWKIIGHVYFNYFLEGQYKKVSHWFESGAFSLGSNFETAGRVKEHEINNLEACNWSVRTKLLKQIGGFDTKYLGVGEYHEADAAFKIKKLGYKLIFNPKVFLNHLPSQDGFFNDRPESFTRMENFIRFYMHHIKPSTVSKILKFISYLIFLNGYYFFQGIKMRNLKQFGSMPGTISGLVKYYKSS